MQLRPAKRNYFESKGSCNNTLKRKQTIKHLFLWYRVFILVCECVGKGYID